MKRFCFALAGFAGFALALASPLAARADDSELARDIAVGKRIAPVPLRLATRDPSTVYFGAYLVEAVATCNSCHSNKEFTATGNPFNGQPKEINKTCYMNGGQGFGPGVVSRNLTPDSMGRPAGLTFGQFKNVLRTGVDPEDPGTLLQVMPWDGFKNMTDFDIKAMYEYLSTIPTLPTGGTAPC